MASALSRADLVGARAAALGFDWPDLKGPRAKIDEEIAELDEAIDGAQVSQMEDELGDLLFSVVNLARHIGVDPEAALDKATAKFLRRFAKIEAAGIEGRSLAELDSLWEDAKR